MNVILVEDDAAQATMLAQWLRRNGFAVTVAMSIAEAARMIEEIAFDAAVCDYRVPDAIGNELGQLFTSLQVPFVWYTIDEHVNISPKIMKPNVPEVIEWLNRLAERKGGAKC